jgi:SAM-dependent methyltransferase
MAIGPEDWTQRTRAAGDHREFVGPSAEYDVNAATQFNLLTFLGLREYHTLLDIGCGSLRGGRLFIVYLLPGHYYGLEPERWLVENGIDKEIGRDLVRLKRPSFSYNGDFACRVFKREFDYILAQGVFVHAPDWQIRKCVSEAAQCMKPTSVFAATYMEGDQNFGGTEWVYPKTTTYTLARMKEIASSAGLRCVPIGWPHPRSARWVVFCTPESAREVLHLADRARRLHHFDRQAPSETSLSQLARHAYMKTRATMGRFVRRPVR